MPKKYYVLIFLFLFYNLGHSQVVDWSYEMPNAINQYNTGACVAFSISYLMTRNICKKMGWDPKDPKNQMSPSFISNQLYVSIGSVGTMSQVGLDFVIQNGICKLNEFPFDTINFSIQPNILTRFRSLKYRAKKWDVTFNLDTAKSWLNNDPIISILTNTSGSLHSICIVGYNDSTQLFKYLNSAGPYWGDNGYGYVSYQNLYTFYRLTDRDEYTLPYKVFQFNWNYASFFEFGQEFNFVFKSYLYNIIDTTLVSSPVLNNYLFCVEKEEPINKIYFNTNYTKISASILSNNKFFYDLSEYDTINGLQYISFDTSSIFLLVKDTIMQSQVFHKYYYNMDMLSWCVYTNVEKKEYELNKHINTNVYDILGRKNKGKFYIKNNKKYIRF